MATRKTTVKKEKSYIDYQISEMYEAMMAGKITEGQFVLWVSNKKSDAWREGASEGFQR